jgi:hypothetical protein
VKLILKRMFARLTYFLCALQLGDCEAELANQPTTLAVLAAQSLFLGFVEVGTHSLGVDFSQLRFQAATTMKALRLALLTLMLALVLQGVLQMMALGPMVLQIRPPLLRRLTLILLETS